MLVVCLVGPFPDLDMNPGRRRGTGNGYDDTQYSILDGVTGLRKELFAAKILRYQTAREAACSLQPVGSLASYAVKQH